MSFLNTELNRNIRDEIRRLTEEFLSKGGEIQKLDHGATGHREMSMRERYAYQARERLCKVNSGLSKKKQR
jgi:hypothetical protein